MSPKLKPLLLPQLVEERRKIESIHHAMPVAGTEAELPCPYFNPNSSSSDVASPLTPTFSTRDHLRCSSSTSSLDMPPLPQETPSSPIQPASAKMSKRPLPDVEEEPVDVEREHDEFALPDQFGLYSCLCDEPCEHQSSSDDLFPTEIIGDYDFDYDTGAFGDSDWLEPRYTKQKRSVADSPFLALSSRVGSRFNTISRWRSNRRPNLMASPTTELSLENVLSREPSSRSSSMSVPPRHSDRFNEPSVPATPAMSYFDSTDSFAMSMPIDIDQDERASLERDRALATTPLLPPLMMNALSPPPQESPLQSPTVAPSSAATEIASPPMSPLYPRPSLSSKPSVSSFRHGASAMELPFPLPAILQEHDEWSDRLGHANFTITPLPYELETVNIVTVEKFRDDWDTARVNYTKHLVRTGENYGQTSKIYALTEAKWAETERRWRDVYDSAVRQTMSARHTTSMSASTSRSRSRGRTRGRSGSAAATLINRPHDDVFAGMEWRRLEGGLPSAVPKMLEALDAQGKFPGLGDEDIVGPMKRDEVMLRAHSEERKGSRFWRNLAEKVGLRP